MNSKVFSIVWQTHRRPPGLKKDPAKDWLKGRTGCRALWFATLLLVFSASSSWAGEILLSDFSGYETVVTMSEIPSYFGDPLDPLISWDRRVKGIYLWGGRDWRLPGSSQNNPSYVSPFSSPPTAGDPAGFSTASLGIALEVGPLINIGLTDSSFKMDFRGLAELPQRIGFLASFSSNNPDLGMVVNLTTNDQDKYYFYEAGSRLIAIEDGSGIQQVTVWTKLLSSPMELTTFPRVTLDDIRFESFPYGADVTVSAGLMTQGQAGFPSFDNDEPLRKRGEGTLVLDAANLLSGPTEVMQGGVLLAHPSALSRSPISVSDGAVLGVANRVNASIPSLDLGSSALVDISTGSLEIANGFTPDGIKARLLQGRADGTWTGSAGITSSAVVADIGNIVARTVGWKASADGSVTVAYSAPGDTNIDGEVNVFDLVGVNSSGTYGKGNASVWSQGDFDYNGVTNVFDLVLTNGAGVYGRGSYLPVAAPSGVSVVPEPCICPLAIAGFFHLIRRAFRPKAS